MITSSLQSCEVYEARHERNMPGNSAEFRIVAKTCLPGGIAAF